MAGGVVTEQREPQRGGRASAPAGRGRLPLVVALLPALVALAVACLAPLASLLRDSVIMDGALTFERYSDLLGEALFRDALLVTLENSVIVTAACLLLGYPLAYWIATLPPKRAGLMLLLVVAPAFSSVLIRSFGWIAILSDTGLVNTILLDLGIVDRPLRLVFNRLGTLIGMVQILLPLLVLPLYSTMRGIDRSLVRAAQSLGAAPATAFRRVFLPLSLPGVAAGCCLVFVVALGYYVTPQLLGGIGTPMVAQLITTEVTQFVDFPMAAAQAGVLLVLVSAALVLMRRPLGLAADDLVRRPPRRRLRRLARRLAPGEHAWAVSLGRAVTTVERAVSRVRRPLLIAWSIVVLALLLLPFVVIVPTAFTSGTSLAFPPPSLSTRWFEAYLTESDFLSATWLSLTLALASALLATAVGTLAAYALVRSRFRGRTLAQLLLLAPLVLPQIVLAVAVFFLAARAGLIGRRITFVLPYTVLGLPYVVVVMTAALRTFDRSLERAGASLGANPWQVARRITLPLLRPALLTAFAFAFITAFDDVVFALFLNGGGLTTLPVRMFQEAQDGSPVVAAISVVIIAALLVAAGLLRLASGRVGRRARRAAS